MHAGIDRPINQFLFRKRIADNSSGGGQANFTNSFILNLFLLPINVEIFESLENSLSYYIYL
jgi:hypothetical protein